MYEEIIAHLRECAKIDMTENTYEETANAIEALEKENEKLKRILWEFADKEMCPIPLAMAGESKRGIIAEERKKKARELLR